MFSARMSVLVSISSGVGSGRLTMWSVLNSAYAFFTPAVRFHRASGIEVVHVWNEVHLTVCVECLERIHLLSDLVFPPQARVQAHRLSLHFVDEARGYQYFRDAFHDPYRKIVGGRRSRCGERGGSLLTNRCATTLISIRATRCQELMEILSASPSD